ncbi:Bifunctional acetohydroxyacid reductoisomerase [Xylographa carneopallida]|nr:Bifunctional acetohydroxyacid reductoisomerase [Xylographa carneopallida]
MASRSFSKALRSQLAHQLVAPPASRGISGVARAGVRASFVGAARASSCGAIQQIRGVKTIDFAGHKEKVFEREDWPREKLLEYFKNDTLALIGYGSQGHGQGLNLRDNGLNVIIGVRKNGASWKEAQQDGWIPGTNLFEMDEAISRGTIVMNLLSDAAQSETWPAIKPQLTKGKTLYFSHGFSPVFKDLTKVDVPTDIDVILVAPKGSGRTVRTLFREGRGINSSIAVFQDVTGKAEEKAVALGVAVGSGYLYKTTFEKEVYSDLYGERGCLMGGIHGMFLAQYEVLRERGHSPSEAFNETVEEATQSLYPLIGANGMDWMYAACSTTARRGAIDWSTKFKDTLKPVFNELYDSVKDGSETKRSLEYNSQPDYREKYEKEMQEIRDLEIWRAGKAISPRASPLSEVQHAMADLERCLPLERSSVESAHDLIKSYIHETPVLTCQTLNDLASTPQLPSALIGTPFEGQPPAAPKINFFFKCENYQRIGAFKIRGASYALERLSPDELRNGVVTHSSGNHAQALALAARTRNVRAHIVMPTISTPSKIAATQGYGADVIFSGSTSEEREAVVADVIARTGATLVPPYDHPDIILGQGTMALELEAQVRELVRRDPALSVRYKGTANRDRSLGAAGVENHISEDSRNGDSAPPESPPATKGAPSACVPPSLHAGHYSHLHAVLAPLGGGGMLSGLATALSPTPTLVFGAEPSFQGADDARRGLVRGARVPSVQTLTIADGLRTPLSPLTWRVVSDPRLVEGVYAVSEAQIAAAMRLVFERMKLVVEPSAVVGLAVALWDEGFRRVVERRGGREGWDVGVVLSGGNVGVEALGGLFRGGGEREVGKVGSDGERVAEDVAG